MPEPRGQQRGALTRSLRGVMTALVTPFRAGGELDVPAFERLVRRQIDAGIDGLVPCGTTGETPTLSTEEKERVVTTTLQLARAAGRKVPVVAGTGSNGTAATVEATRRARALGVDAALIVTPYYNKPTQEGLYRHYRTVAEQAELPIIAYNVPGRTGVDMLPETVARLARDVPLVVGIKEAVADVARVQRLRLLLETALGPAADDFVLLTGEDANLLPFLAAGGHGAISVTSNVDPAGVLGVARAVAEGDLAAARRLFYALLPLHGALFLESNPIPVKAALSRLGLCEDVLRLPLCPMSSELRPKLHEALAARGLVS